MMLLIVMSWVASSITLVEASAPVMVLDLMFEPPMPSVPLLETVMSVGSRSQVPVMPLGASVTTFASSPT